MIKAKLADRATQVRFFRFLAVGGAVAVVQFSILAVAKTFLAPNLAFTGSFVVATATHYAMNRFWALPSDRIDRGQQLTEYALTVVLSYLINIGVFVLARSVFGLGVMWAAVCAVPPATIAVFLILNYRVFRRRG